MEVGEEAFDGLLGESGEVFGAATSFAVAAELALVAAALEEAHVFEVVLGGLFALGLDGLFLGAREFGFFRFARFFGLVRLFFIVFWHIYYYSTNACGKLHKLF